MKKEAMTMQKAFTMPSLAGLALALVLSLVGTSGAHAYECKGSVVHAEAIANLRLQARSAARTNWTNAAKAQYGLSWSVWDIASSKSMDCSWTGSKFWCVAEAKPCLYVAQ
jgi:hypothetical protein